MGERHAGGAEARGQSVGSGVPGQGLSGRDVETGRLRSGGITREVHREFDPSSSYVERCSVARPGDELPGADERCARDGLAPASATRAAAARRSAASTRAAASSCIGAAATPTQTTAARCSAASTRASASSGVGVATRGTTGRDDRRDGHSENPTGESIEGDHRHPFLGEEVKVLSQRRRGADLRARRNNPALNLNEQRRSIEIFDIAGTTHSG
jgi:hypothetical protein